MTINTGNILDVADGIVVHGCNAQGVMGSGIAKEIKERFPEVFDAYREIFTTKGLSLGQVILCPPTPRRPFWIANAITQQNYGRDPKVRYVSYEALRACFSSLASFAHSRQLRIHYPKIGAGLANGDWDTISTIIEQELAQVPHQLWVLPSPSPTPSVTRAKPRRGSSKD